MLIALNFVALLVCCKAFSIKENKYGLVHQKEATKCIFEAVRKLFRPRSLITVLARDDLDTPGFEIEGYVISDLESLGDWTIEITNGSRNIFESYSECINCNTALFEEKLYKHHYQPIVRTNYYIIIIDTLETLKLKIDTVKKMRTFRIEATYFVYFFTVISNYDKMVNDIFNLLYINAIYKVIILVATSQSEFKLYGYDLYSVSDICATDPEVVLLNTCTNGHYNTNRFQIRSDFKNLNCTINAIIMIDPPFIVDNETGFEINLLREIEYYLNVSFNMSNKNEEAEDWGSKLDGKWTNLLGVLEHEPFMIGVGSVWVTSDRKADFDYTDCYYIDKTVWVVPSALKIPKWSSLIHIFSFNLWICLLAVNILFGILFYYASIWNSWSEYNVFKEYGFSFLLSIQIFFGSAVKTQPKSNALRILYIHQVIVCIVIACLFQSGLIDVMSNAKFYKEIDSYDEVFESGIGIGGISVFRDIFNQSDPRSQRILNNYEIYDVVNDTLFVWLLTVAKDRDTITILSEAYVRYLIAIGEHGIVNHDGTPKIYIVPDILYTFSVGIIFYRGYPLKEGFNEVIRGLTHAGLIEKWRKEFFSRRAHKKEEGDNEEESNGVNVISFDDISGAFAFLFCGYICGTVTFSLEMLVGNIKLRKQLKRVKYVELWKRALVKTKVVITTIQTTQKTADKGNQVGRSFVCKDLEVMRLNQAKKGNKSTSEGIYPLKKKQNF